MDIVLFLTFGLLVGGLVSWFTRAKGRGAWIASGAVGVVGALLGGFLGRAVEPSRYDEPAPLLMSLVGAVVLTGVYQLVLRERATA